MVGHFVLEIIAILFSKISFYFQGNTTLVKVS